MHEASTVKTHGWYGGSLSELPNDEKYQVVDICKFVFAFFVVAIHVSPLASYGSETANAVSFVLRQIICRIADPFYFVAAGFLLFRKIDLVNPETDRIKSYLFKILRLYGLWSVLLLAGGNGQLWFLGGLAVAVLVVLALMKLRLSKVCVWLGSLALFAIGVIDVSFGASDVIGVLPDTLILLFRGVNSTVRLGLIMGVPYVVLGLLFAKNKIVLNWGTAMLGCAGSLALMIVEASALHYFEMATDYYQLVMLYPFSFFFFYFVTHIRVKDRPIYRKLRVVGMIVFYSHLFAYKIVVVVSEIIFKAEGIANNSLLHFFCTVVLSVAAGVCIEVLSRTERFSFLKYLYS